MALSGQVRLSWSAESKRCGSPENQTEQSARGPEKRRVDTGPHSKARE